MTHRLCLPGTFSKPTVISTYLHEVGHRCTEILGNDSQQQRVTRQNFMPKEGSPRDLGGRAQKLGEEEEQSRISVLEFPPLTLSVDIRKQQQIILTIKLRPRHLEGTRQIPRKPKTSNTRAACKFCIFYSVLCVRNCS